MPVPPKALGEIGLDLINSRFANHLTGEIQDRLGRPRWQERFLSRHGLEVDPAATVPLARLRLARAELRGLLERWAAGAPIAAADRATLDGMLAAVPGTRRAAGGEAGLGVVFEPRRRDWRWVLSEVAASTLGLLDWGEPARLKVCGNPACTWLFYDQSHNSSRRWCDVATCGNLVKVREFRARRRVAATSA